MDINAQNTILKPKINPYTTVTTLSKIAALTLFVALPFIGFYFGVRYQKSITVQPTVTATIPTEPKQETTVVGTTENPSGQDKFWEYDCDVMYYKQGNPPEYIKTEPDFQPTDCSVTYYKCGIPVSVITSFEPDPAVIGDVLKVNGCNLLGFEGDKIVIIEDSKGNRGFLKEDYNITGIVSQSDDKTITVALERNVCQNDTSYSGLPCDKLMELVPGKYTIHALSWSGSNKLEIELK